MNESYPYNYLRFKQPIGEFFFSIVPAAELLQFYTIVRRQYTGDKGEGTQRKYSPSRINEICDYVSTADACFPTAVILAVEEGDYSLDIKGNKINILKNRKAEIVDGQHRIMGIEAALKKYGESVIEEFDIPCIFILEPTEEQKAYIFATINGKQEKVNSSVVFDLFGVSKFDDPFTILHKVARTLNFKKNSPFHGRLKMLGDRVTGDESLAQGTFIKHLIPKITKNPMLDRDKMHKKQKLEAIDGLVLRPYLINENTEGLISLMSNIFNAVKDTWPTEWADDKNYILSKTTGYTGIIKGIDPIVEFGLQNKILSKAYFSMVFMQLKENLQKEGLNMTSKSFPPGGVGEGHLANELKTSWEKIKPTIEKVLQDLINKAK